MSGPRGAAEPETARIRATYLLRCGEGDEPERRARDLAWEQTVELPPGSVSAELEERAVGRVEELAETADGRWRARVSYPAAACAGDLAQLLNLLWGNVSLERGVRLERLRLPAGLRAELGGPAFGIEGVRRASGVRGRALLCAALKPLGSSPGELADLAREFALGGADLVKDDHSLADQPWAPFADRLRRCRDAVAEANARTGGRSLYVPSVSGSPERIAARVEAAVEAGCRGVLLNALPVGLPALRAEAARGRAFVLAHPSFAGGFLGPEHGVAPDVLLGTLFRLAGADGVVYPNAGGRFPFDVETCRAVNRRLREPLGGVRRAFPVPGGGINVERIPRWAEAYGHQTVFLIGGGLYRQPDRVGGTRRLIDELERIGTGGADPEP